MSYISSSVNQDILSSHATVLIDSEKLPVPAFMRVVTFSEHRDYRKLSSYTMDTGDIVQMSV